MGLLRSSSWLMLLVVLLAVSGPQPAQSWGRLKKAWNAVTNFFSGAKEVWDSVPQEYKDRALQIGKDQSKKCCDQCADNGYDYRESRRRLAASNSRRRLAKKKKKKSSSSSSSIKSKTQSTYKKPSPSKYDGPKCSAGFYCKNEKVIKAACAAGYLDGAAMFADFEAVDRTLDELEDRGIIDSDGKIDQDVIDALEGFNNDDMDNDDFNIPAEPAEPVYIPYPVEQPAADNTLSVDNWMAVAVVLLLTTCGIVASALYCKAVSENKRLRRKHGVSFAVDTDDERIMH